jgi:acyl-CoA reductase-like NAD-dependent aldehyde dehydrogenase
MATEKIKLETYPNIVAGDESLEGERTGLASPLDGKTIGYAIVAGREELKRAIDLAHDAYIGRWGKTGLAERKRLLSRLADLVQERSDTYSMLESMNTGKTIRQSSLMDIPLGIEHIRYFAQEGAFSADREIDHPEYPGSKGIVQNVPMGVVGAIVPWNVPFLMAVWKLAPALLAGNSVVLKPSTHTPLTALELARDIYRAGFPRGSVSVVNVPGPVAGEEFSHNGKVGMVSFTGSTDVGRNVAVQCANNLKKVTLELGGKSPNIVLQDADIGKAAIGVMFGIYLNSGQLCESGSRLLVHTSIREKLQGEIVRLMSKLRPGNPMSMDTDISAITTPEQKRKIETMVESGEMEGANVLFRKNLAGSVPAGGLYYPPTLLSGADPESRISREEIFGPVLNMLEFDSDDEAVEIANRTEYGLAAGVWSKDLKRAESVAGRIEAGTVWVNQYHLLSAAAPRGGFKKSGLGRELGLEGIMELTQTRHIFIGAEDSDMDVVEYGLLLPPD